MIEIKIPFKTPTSNHLYWHKGNIKIMKSEAKELRERINQICLEIPNTLKEGLKEKLKVEVEIHENWYTKKWGIARKDISNREKFLTDSVFKSLGIDDKLIFEHTMKKVQSETEFAIIKISIINQ